MIELTNEQRRRFYDTTHHDEFTGCLEWQGALDKDGYGVFYANYRSYKAHRLAYLLQRKEQPGKLCVLHRCDNPKCVNIHHLFLGTALDNVADRVAKGRTRNGNNNCLGEKSHLAKITDEQADQIRTSSEKGCILAERFGISQAQVSRIRKNISRKVLT